MKSTRMMWEMTWPEYQERLQDQGAILFLPVGSLEQHGPHLPLGTDTLLVMAVATCVAERVNGIVMPPVSYGYKSQPRTGGGNQFCGTTSLDASTLVGLVRDVLKEIGRHGARKIVVMDGHYENSMFLVEAIDLALRELHSAGVHNVKIIRLGYFEFATRQTLAKVFPDGFPGYDLEHAAVLETSLCMYLCPGLVRAALIPQVEPARFPSYDVYPVDADWIPASGVLSSPEGASALKGKLLIQEYIERIAEAVEREFGGPS